MLKYGYLDEFQSPLEFEIMRTDCIVEIKTRSTKYFLKIC